MTDRVACVPVGMSLSSFCRFLPAFRRPGPIRSLLLACLLTVIAACGSPGEPEGIGSLPRTDPPGVPPDGSYAYPYIGTGVVTEIRGGIVQIEHESIPGFMAAVTMDFPLENTSLAAGLAPGDRVRFHIEVPNSWSMRIIHIERAE